MHRKKCKCLKEVRVLTKSTEHRRVGMCATRIDKLVEIVKARLRGNIRKGLKKKTHGEGDGKGGALTYVIYYTYCHSIRVLKRGEVITLYVV